MVLYVEAYRALVVVEARRLCLRRALQGPTVDGVPVPLMHVVNYSGGMSSHLAAKRIVDEVGAENVTLLFCDTKSEDADLYRFVTEGAAQLGAKLVTIADGRTIWEVMAAERYLANTRADPCSKILKRELADAWLLKRFVPAVYNNEKGIPACSQCFSPEELKGWRECSGGEKCWDCGRRAAVRVFGFNACEPQRFERTSSRLAPWKCRAPLCEDDTKSTDVRALLAEECPGLRVPRLYDLGAPHNNCGGLCVKAGQGQFAWALAKLPEVFAEWESEEAKLRAQLGDVSILRDRRGGTTKPLPLSVFRARIEAGARPAVAPGDDQSCRCFDSDEK